MYVDIQGRIVASSGHRRRPGFVLTRTEDRGGGELGISYSVPAPVAPSPLRGSANGSRWRRTSTPPEDGMR